jgi:hypothetical protein
MDAKKDRIPVDDDFVPGDPGSVKSFVLKLAGGQLIQAGYVNKRNEGDLMVRFPSNFRLGTTPVVTLTPNWPEGQVGYIETLLGVSDLYFKFTSENAKDNYYVAWTAIGEAP